MRLAVLAHALSTHLLASLESARVAGFGGVVLDPAIFPALIDASQTGRREIVHHLDRSGQTLVGIDVKLDSLGLSPRGDAECEIDRVTRAIDLARGLRSNLVLCDLGPLPPAPDELAAPKPAIAPAALGRLILPEAPKSTAPPPPAMPRDLPFETSVETALRELGERADRAGCLVAFRSSLGSIASLARSMKAADCAYFGVDLDPVAVLADTWDLDAIFSAIGPLIRHVRGRDGIKGVGGRVVPAEIGRGQTDWPTLLQNCHETDYDSFVTLDTIDLADRRHSAINGAAVIRAANI